MRAPSLRLLTSPLRLLLLLASLSGCSLLFPTLLPEECDPETFLPSCDGSILSSCRGGYTVELNCGEDTCDAAQNACLADPCGNGALDAPEECDDGNQDNTDDCVVGCVQARCGDGFVLAGTEACDDGNNLDTDLCLNSCQLPSCGDGVVSAGEQCDDSNNAPGDGCDALCVIEPPLSCGDGALDAGEECDDGNTLNGDGCEANCALVCGNGSGALRATLDPANGHCYLGFGSDNTLGWNEAEFLCEAQGGYLTRIDSEAENLLARTASLSSLSPWIGFNDLEVEAFGDAFGFVGVDGSPLLFSAFAGGEPNNFGGLGEEDCVHFFGDSLLWNDLTCLNFDIAAGFLCELEPVTCGDGIAQEPIGEQCDDGNNLAGDGCAANCQAEPGCGNRFVEGGESCDDGNTTAGDGCDATCQIEPGHFFESEPNDDADVSTSDDFFGNDFLAANADLVPGVEVIIHGAISVPGDEDVFRITNTNATAIDLVIRTFAGVFGTCPNAVDTVLLIRDVDGNILDADDDDGLGFCSLSAGTLAPGETIFVQILDLNDAGNLFSYLVVLSACGDNNLDIGEECDDGNPEDNDGCSAICRTEGCGDNAIQTAEECDDGNTNNGDGCESDCQLSCGNGTLDPNEGCDDTNNLSNDGCSAVCQLEAQLFVLCDGTSGGDGTLANPFRVLSDAVIAANALGVFEVMILPQSPLPCGGTGLISGSILLYGLADLFASNVPPAPVIDGGASPAVQTIGDPHVELQTLNLRSSSSLGTARLDGSAHLGLIFVDVQNTGAAPAVQCRPASNNGDEEGAMLLYSAVIHDSPGGGVLVDLRCRGIIANSLLRGNGGPASEVGAVSVVGVESQLSVLYAIFDGNASSTEGAARCDAGSNARIDSSIITGSNGATPTSAACAVQFSDTQGVTTPGTGNLSADPLFVSATPVEFFDYALQSGSPCIDSANPNTFALPFDPSFAFGRNLFFEDAIFDFRPQGAGPDMGMFEDF